VAGDEPKRRRPYALIREPNDKRQGNSEPGHVPAVESPDLSPETFAPDGNQLIRHDLRCDAQSVLRLGLDGDAKSGASTRSDVNRHKIIEAWLSENASVCTMTAGRGLP
jgi:hypothetical protein